jgi:selenocysteine lyase/cysteine desulfurase
MSKLGRGSLAPRSEFPALRGAVYADSASFGVIPSPVRAQLAEFERHGPGTADFNESIETALCEQARRSAARLLRAAETDIALMTSATDAIGQLAWWRRPARGTNVVSADHEFPTITYPWLQVAKHTGAEVRFAEAARDPERFSLDGLAELVDEQTEVICISHVHHYTGHSLDLAALADLAHAVDALLVVDATQSAGAVPIDVTACGVDVVVSSGYKWLCGPGGAAFCFMRPEVWRALDPPFAGWRSTLDPDSLDPTRIQLADGARRMEYHTPVHAPLCGLAASIEYVLALDVERIFSHNLALTEQFVNGIVELGGIVVGGVGRALGSSIVTVSLADGARDAAARALSAANVVCAVRREGIRFAWHMFNDTDDVELVLAVIRAIRRRP